MVATTRSSYAAGNFELQIDGHAPCSYVRSVEGGWSRGVMKSEEDSFTGEAKQFTAVEIDPTTVELGLMSSVGMLHWIFRINLQEVGMVHLSLVQANANADQIKRVRFELFVRKMTLEGSNLIGFM